MSDVAVKLAWTGAGLEFDGGSAGGPHIHMDGDNRKGVSPMVTLLLAVGGCMGADIVDIATKSRATMESLVIDIEGDRASDFPRRYTALRMRFAARGVPAADEPKLQRALEMSREKYCSVLHSLRTDISLDIQLVVG